MDKKIPKKYIKNSDIIKKTDDNLAEFDLIPVNINKILATQNNDILVLLSTEEKSLLFPLNDIEATMLTFIQSGCARNPHINTIYHLYIGTLKEINTRIESVTIEAQDGDVWYARLKLINAKNKPVYCQCTIGDAVILSICSQTQLYIVRRALDEADAFEEDTDDNFFFDEDEDIE